MSGTLSNNLPRGSLVGANAFSASVNDHYGTTVQAGHEGMKVLAWDAAKLREAMGKDPEFALGLNRFFHGKLCNDLDNAIKTAAESEVLSTYVLILEACLADERIPPAEKRILRDYRKSHGVTQQQHDQLVVENGWTLDEFHDGGRTFFTRQQTKHALEKLAKGGVKFRAGTASDLRKAI